MVTIIKIKTMTPIMIAIEMIMKTTLFDSI